METFNDVISEDRLVLVDFFATWCQPCKMMHPVLEQLKDTLGDRVRIIKVDVDKYGQTAAQYGIQAVPTLMLFRNGQPPVVTRKIENSDILIRFDRLLRNYFEDKLQLTLGLPTVQYCADKLCMSPNYFGDVIKKTTGDTASSHIRRFVLQLAKNGLAAGETVSQVSDRLGFEYPQHFSRMFKKQEGITPSEYCQRLQG